MSPSRIHAQPSPRSAHGSWMTHLHPLDALADTLPFVMPDTSSRPVGCSGLAFREPRARPVTRIVSHSKTIPACETRPRPSADTTTPSAQALFFT
jgi:hypothetical protein